VTEALLPRIKSKLYLHARRRVLSLLDGQYRSLLRGRSMDFDDLRAYVAGDEVKDIDWKATARHGSPLVRRYQAERQHRVLFVVDRGRNMAAVGASGEPKRGIATTAMGALGWLALRHGDDVGLVTGDEHGVEQFPFRGKAERLEAMLHAVHDRATLDAGRSDMRALLERVRDTVSRRLFLVVIADEIPWDDEFSALVRRLAAQHEVLWLEVVDADPAALDAQGRRTRDVAGTWAMPEFLRGDKLLHREFEYEERRRQIRMETDFDRGAVTYARITGSDAVIPEVLTALKARSRVRH